MEEIELRQTNLVRQDVDTDDAQPIKLAPRRVATRKITVVKKETEDKLIDKQ